MDQGSGLLSQMGMDDRLKGEGAPPDHGGAGLGPWTFRVGLVNSFGGRFIEGSQIDKSA